MNAVTGSVVHNTVIFSGALKYIVFSPYWTVPPDILKNEVLPEIEKNKTIWLIMIWNGVMVK